MFEKGFELPIRIEKLEVIVRRLRETHLKKHDIVNEYNNRLTGHLGEKAVVFYLDALPYSEFRIYHDIRLLLGGYYFQIDFLIICSKFILVLQVKNRGKDWHFEKTFKQATLNNKGIQERTQNPVIEAKIQAKKLKNWLEEHNIVGIPIEYLFVNSNENVQIYCNDYEMNQYMCNSEFLLDKIEQIENKHRLVKLDETELKKLNRLLLTKHTPDNPDLIQYFNLSIKEDILTGVQCPNRSCNFLPLTYKSGTWHCPKCRTKSKTVFISGIQDYFLIISPSITNSQARNFLQVPSRKTMHHLLNTMELIHTGKLKGRVYFPPPKK
nr:nuclease-related domain-containing protein [Neobacillus sp. Marseille-Q6967]